MMSSSFVEESGGFIRHRVQETRQSRRGGRGREGGAFPHPPPAAAAAVCGFSLDFVCGPISCAMNVWLAYYPRTEFGRKGRNDVRWQSLNRRR